jgi:hypothetical protein
MSLGNLHPDPNDPTKTIRTGHANIPVRSSLADDLRFFAMSAAIITAVFLGKKEDALPASPGAPQNAHSAVSPAETQKDSAVYAPH